jgi:Transposase DDE domain
MLEVRKLIRASNHKVCKSIEYFGKNYYGLHYGFQVHTVIDLQGNLCGIVLTLTKYS